MNQRDIANRDFAIDTEAIVSADRVRHKIGRSIVFVGLLLFGASISSVGYAQQVNQTISFGPVPTIVVGGKGSISAISSSGLVASFTSVTPDICTVSGSIVTSITAGTCSIVADQTGNDSIAAASTITQSIVISSTPPLSAVIALVPGWNLVGNGANAPLTVATTFNNSTNVLSVWKWNSATGKWAFYSPSLANGGTDYAATNGYDALTTINGGEGFWVNAKTAFNATLPPGDIVTSASIATNLRSGWGMISIGDSKTPSSFNSSIGLTPLSAHYTTSDITSLWAWDPNQATWYFYSPSLAKSGDLTSYITSRGYLDFEAKPLDSTTGFWVNKPAAVVVPRPGFIKGAFTMDVGGFMADTYSGGYFDPTYARIKGMVGANLVANSDPVFMISYDETTNKVVMSKESSPGSGWRMFNKDEYAQLVSKARANGMAFLLLLGITNPPGTQPLPWTVSSTNTAFWTAWFDAYKNIAVEYAAIARDLEIEYLSLGLNAGYMSTLPVGYWRPLVEAVRGTGYKGKLLYQAMPNMDHSWGEQFGFNESCCGDLSIRESKRLEFISLFDYIVLDIYNIVKGRSSPPEASRDEMKDSVRWLFDQVKTYPVPVMIMVGTPSVHGGATIGDYIEPCLICNSIAPTKQRDDMQQSDVYQAIAEVINATPTGNGNVAGLLTWGYWFTDDYLKWGSLAMAYDKSASVRGKPAEAVLKWWFDRW